jgi:SAM-dependent methyltransferase
MEKRYNPAPPKLIWLRVFAMRLKSWWFDVRHGVETRATKSDKLPLNYDRSRGFEYLPIWPKMARAVFRQLPRVDYSEFTFIDLGSGKGRMLLFAAEQPFRRVLGVEMNKALHERAEKNIASYRNLRPACPDVQSIHADATEFEFPDENLVVYFFNPFGEAITQRVLERLGESLRRAPREVVVVMCYPEFAYVADRMPHLRSYQENDSFYIYRSCVARGSAA